LVVTVNCNLNGNESNKEMKREAAEEQLHESFPPVIKA